MKDIRGFTRPLIEIREYNKSKLNEVEQSRCDALVDREWDNVIILDGCRYDLYSEYFPETGKRYSVGSVSKEFISRNFSDKDMSNTVCVTANPFYTKKWFKDLTGSQLKQKFHSVFDTIMTDWDEEERTVLPHPVVRDAKTAQKLFLEKKKLIHFMQPHYPFIGKDLGDIGIPQIAGEENEFGVSHGWSQVQRGFINHDDAVEGYRQNLEIVLKELQSLIDELEGKTVVTADHGNFVGEYGIYGHPSENQFEKLREVPWHVVESSKDLEFESQL